MEPKKPDINLLASHQDQVVSIPEHAKIFLNSEFCPNAGFYIKDQVVTFQGHPEFSPEYSKALMDLRENVIPKEQFTRGQASLKHAESIDHLLVTRWILAFIRQAALS